MIVCQGGYSTDVGVTSILISMGLSLPDLTALSCKSLLGNPLRSGLSMIGVFMGVAAVSATLQVGKISEAVIAKQLFESGAPRVGFWWGRNTTTKQWIQLDTEDLNFLSQRLKGLKAISGQSWVDSGEVVFQSQSASPRVFAVMPDYHLALGKTLAQGRDFTPADYEQYRPVVIIDQFLADTLFQREEPLSKSIYINLRPYVVVGVVPTNLQEEEPEGLIYMPFAIYSATTGEQELGVTWLRPDNLDDLEHITEQTEKLLEQRFPGYTFYVWNTVEDVLEQKKTLESVSVALLVVGIIALLVGWV
ncbi:MAG: ABC transporter permease [Microcoleaceae cyanobacterium]